MEKILITLISLNFLCCDDKKSDKVTDTASDQIVEIYLVDPLDEARGFCLDIKGYKANANISNGLQAHSCYSYQGQIAVDQGFSFMKLSKNEFFMPSFDVCMEANFFSQTADLDLNYCDSNKLQKFIFTSNGSIRLESNQALCLTVAQGKSRNGGGGDPVHLIRSLTLDLCSDDLMSYQTWDTRSIE